MSGAQAGGPDQSFHDRLNRVVQNQYPDEDTTAAVQVLPDIKSRFSGKFGMLLALFLGLAAVVAVRVGRYHMTGAAMIGEDADMTLIIEFGAAMTLSLCIFMLMPFRGFQFTLMQFGGVVVMISMMHNAVHSAPGVFNALFSPEWTAAVTEETKPNSLYLRGEVIPFIKEEKKLPVVRRG